MYNIFLIEDSSDLKDLIFHIFGPTFNMSWASSLAEAQSHLRKHIPDIIILDVQLPDGDGFHFTATLMADPKYKDIPIVLLTSKSDIPAKLLGFSLGVEDYITKPFEPSELKARIEMRLKKNSQRKDQVKSTFVGNIEINFSMQKAFILDEGNKVDLELTSMEFKLLVQLGTHVEQVFSRDQLLDKIYGSEIGISDRSIDSHIYSLRKKMGYAGACIQTVYGAGYRFTLNLQNFKNK